jgi:saccharopine dehydrogenase-like NADP-dependent oxidoreductase
MKKILLLGAGKSSTILIDYLLNNATEEAWSLTIADADLSLAEKKISGSPAGWAVELNVNNDLKRKALIESSDLVISLLPPSLHLIVAIDCLHYKRNLLTASYVSNELKGLSKEISNSGLLFLCEMGLDPGIDHMSAKNIIDHIKANDGIITSFISHCGGLIASESDDNPWHYKISWNPRNIINAGKEGAIYKKNGKIIQLTYPEVFAENRFLKIGKENFCWYPNRNSMQYAPIYGLKDCSTFIRTTLRHPDFMYGWKNLIDLKLTDDTKLYESNGKTLHDLFKEHLNKNNFNHWLEEKIHHQFETTRLLLDNLVNLTELENLSSKEGLDPVENFMMVSEKGSLQNIDVDDLKNDTAARIASKLHESKLTLSQLFYLGMDDRNTYVNIGKCSASDLLQFAMENKLALNEHDKDRIVMMHEIEYMTSDVSFKVRSLLDIKGENKEHTAMAKTVGLPLGIAAKLILKGQIQMVGLHIPIIKEIYQPVLEELKLFGIEFEEHTQVSKIN